MWPIIERIGRSQWRVLDQGRKVTPVPSVAHHGAEQRAFALQRLQGAAKLGLNDQEALIVDAFVNRLLLALDHFDDRVAHLIDQTFARREAAFDPVSAPGRRGQFEDLADAAVSGAFARLGGVSDKQRIEVRVVRGALDDMVRPMPERIAKIDETANQQERRIALGMWRDGPDDFAGRAMERLLRHHRKIWNRGPAGGGVRAIALGLRVGLAAGVIVPELLAPLLGVDVEGFGFVNAWHRRLSS